MYSRSRSIFTPFSLRSSAVPLRFLCVLRRRPWSGLKHMVSGTLSSLLQKNTNHCNMIRLEKILQLNFSPDCDTKTRTSRSSVCVKSAQTNSASCAETRLSCFFLCFCAKRSPECRSKSVLCFCCSGLLSVEMLNSALLLARGWTAGERIIISTKA